LKPHIRRLSSRHDCCKINEPTKSTANTIAQAGFGLNAFGSLVCSSRRLKLKITGATFNAVYAKVFPLNAANHAKLVMTAGQIEKYK
jgi:hypothetical protein